MELEINGKWITQIDPDRVLQLFDESVWGGIKDEKFRHKILKYSIDETLREMDDFIMAELSDINNQRKLVRSILSRNFELEGCLSDLQELSLPDALYIDLKDKLIKSYEYRNQKL